MIDSNTIQILYSGGSGSGVYDRVKKVAKQFGYKRGVSDAFHKGPSGFKLDIGKDGSWRHFVGGGKTYGKGVDDKSLKDHLTKVHK